MLINCPRCGFSQPQDQYCAQCGVDMQSYKPKAAPLLSRLLENTTLQIIILLCAGVLLGQSIIRSEKPQKWVQKIVHFQGINKSTSDTDAAAASESENSLTTNALSEKNTGTSTESSELDSLRNKSLNLTASSSDNSAATANAAANAQDLSSVSFKLTYAEVSHDVLSKWITESSNLGLYQSFTDYSAGIIYDFKKLNSSMHQSLKTSVIKLNYGSTNTNISGIMNDDGSQVFGLVTSIEYRLNENDVIHGNINVSKNSRQSSDVYPAEFGLPKGAAFFIIGALKPENFIIDRAKLNMPPFQVFKSTDFMTRKTEFVIILEPEYK